MNFYMLWLTKVFNVSNVKLMEFSSIIPPNVAYNSTKEDFEELNIPENLIEKLLSTKIKDEAKRDFEFCEKENIKIIDITSNEYPFNLFNIPSPPPILYCKGTLLPQDEISISIVGSRKYSEYGMLCTKKFAYELAKCGISIISGMASGIDSFAHKYALEAKGRTIAVLGNSVNIIYPEENKKLYYDIIQNGAIISEFPLNTAPLPKNFPVRNRIVAGMSLGTLVIEANKKSGTMITARLAAEAGRNVYAVPGSIFSQSSLGTSSLIKDGAKITTSTEDIIEDIFFEISKKLPRSEQISLFDTPKLSDKENVIYKKLSLMPTTIDNLVCDTKLPISELISILSMLEINGYIKSLPGRQYVINAK